MFLNFLRKLTSQVPPLISNEGAIHYYQNSTGSLFWFRSSSGAVLGIQVQEAPTSHRALIHSQNTQSLPYTRNNQHVITSSSRLPIANNTDGTPRHERCNIMYCHYQKKAEWCLETLLCINWLIIEKASHPVQPIDILTKLLPLTPYNLSL